LRKTLLFHFCITFLFLVLPLSAGASNGLVSQDEALEKTKEIFPALAGARDTDIDFELFSDDSGRSQWSVLWIDPDSESYADVVINAEDGTLTYCDLFKEEKTLSVPEKFITRQEAQALAYSFACRHQPKRMESAVLDEDYFDRTFQLDRKYSFTWRHEAAGIPVEGNTITVHVDAATGSVTGFECFWKDISYLPPNNAMDIGEFSSRAVEQLGVFPFYAALPSPSGGLEAKLCYTVDSANHYFDAETGKPLDNSGKDLSWEEAKLVFTGLTPEQKPNQQVTLSGYGRRISFEEAEKAAGAFFEKMGLQGTLEPLGITSNAQPGCGPEELWNYALTPPDESQEPSFVYLSIKAFNGRIAGYDRIFYGGYEDSNHKEITLDEALHTARIFLGAAGIHEQDYFLMPQQATDYNGTDDVYRFWWCRKINGIPSEDFLGIEVSRIYNEVSFFSESFNSLSSFQSVEGLLPPEQAAAKFKEIKPFELIYIWPEGSDNTGPPILAYRVDSKRFRIEAKSGELLDPGLSFWGSMLAGYDHNLRSHWARAPLTLLSETGRLPFPWLFQANTTVKKREALRIMELVTSKASPKLTDLSPFADMPESDRDVLYAIHAVKNDILKPGGNFGPDTSLTREDLAVWIINAMGYKEVADSPVSMNVRSKDASKISKDKTNHVALAQGFRLMNNDKNGNFRPKDPVTWAELAVTIMRAFPRLK